MRIDVSVTCPAYIVAALYPAMSKDPSRYYINLGGINFGADNIAAATDGKILTVACDRVTVNEPGTYQISKAAASKAKSTKAETVKIQGGILIVLDVNENAMHTEPCKPINGRFPDWRRSAPPTSALLVPTKAGFAAEVLTALVETGRAAAKTKNPALTFRAQDEASPHLIRYAGCDTVFTVAMPMRTSDTILDPSAYPFIF